MKNTRGVKPEEQRAAGWLQAALLGMVLTAGSFSPWEDAGTWEGKSAFPAPLCRHPSKKEGLPIAPQHPMLSGVLTVGLGSGDLSVAAQCLRTHVCVFLSLSPRLFITLVSICFLLLLLFLLSHKVVEGKKKKEKKDTRANVSGKLNELVIISCFSCILSLRGSLRPCSPCT